MSWRGHEHGTVNKEAGAAESYRGEEGETARSRRDRLRGKRLSGVKQRDANRSRATHTERRKEKGRGRERKGEREGRGGEKRERI